MDPEALIKSIAYALIKACPNPQRVERTARNMVARWIIPHKLTFDDRLIVGRQDGKTVVLFMTKGWQQVDGKIEGDILATFDANPQAMSLLFHGDWAKVAIENLSYLKPDTPVPPLPKFTGEVIEIITLPDPAMVELIRSDPFSPYRAMANRDYSGEPPT